MPEQTPGRGPVGGVLGAVLSRAYGWEIARRNRRFDAGRGVVRFDRPVISIGNLSVGGTGKTPTVMHVLRVLLEAGHRPCIAMRGYRSAGGQSDEAEEYRRMFPSVPVVAQPDRIQGLIRLFYDEYEGEAPHSDCIILDDGFQHRRIGREMDVVLVDASRSPFADRLLPAGWLREPVQSLGRATHIVITHAESSSSHGIRELEQAIADRTGQAAIAVTRHAWGQLHLIRGGAADATEVIAPEQLQRGKGFALCAIGHPEPFIASARQLSGGQLAGQLILRDHDPYRPQTIQRALDEAAAAGAAWIVTTGKDWSKLQAVSPQRWPCPVVAPQLELDFDRGREAFDAAILETLARGVPDDEEGPA